MAATPQVLAVDSVEDATGRLAELDGDGAPLAGGTWILRAHLRGEALKREYVSLSGIEPLHELEVGDRVRIGALATHARIGTLATDHGPLGALAEAARQSAFPAVRNVATLAGNIRSDPFPEADLLPPLLAGEAAVEISGPGGEGSVALADYLSSRAQRPAAELITAVTLPAPADRRSWFERLTVRGGGEYAVASVALSLDLASDGTIDAARVAVGAIEALPRRVSAAEEALRGQRPDAVAGRAAGEAAAEAVVPRDGLDAPAWYRAAVLPHLLERAVARVSADREA